jgi:CubicO group peptidase (beta-lactamase class C family)
MIRQVVQDLEDFVAGAQSAEAFLDQNGARGSEALQHRPQTLEVLRLLRDALHGGQLSGILLEEPYRVRTEWDVADSDGWQVDITLDAEAPHGIVSLAMQTLESPRSDNPIPLSWETLEAWMEHEGRSHFTGAILVVRDGKPVLSKGYGWANEDKHIRNTPRTVFAIGSTPIDFTIASILQLRRQGRLELSDPITRWFDDVPADKRGITIQHLLSGHSGLRNFHDLPEDPNPDHTWIDRDEAVRRIFSFPLLFAPGTGQAHSHSAFGLLAAIVELASGDTYADYTRTHLFEPAGMRDTGFFGEPIPEDRMAVGRGLESSGAINAPPYWGPTSWLVMGSGGQTSTVLDMGAWLDALHAGTLLDAEDVARIVGPRGGNFGVGGDMFGFEIHYSMAPGTYMVLISNAIDSPARRRALEAMSRELRRLLPDRRNPYTLGISIDADEHGPILAAVAPDSPAARDGLRQGDRLLEIDGQSLQENDPIGILDALLQNGEPIEFTIERQGMQRSVRVTPARRQPTQQP